MRRTVIKIDEKLCNGCGKCVIGCHEGALQLINGKAVVVSDIYCDGLGACIGECPVGAIELEEREALPYSEEAVLERLAEKKDRDLSMSGVSELKHFPVQLHLLNPHVPFLSGANLLLAADCTAFSCGDFHLRYLKNRCLAIACPKLDDRVQEYIDKLSIMIDDAKIDTLTVIMMEVPCCGGLLKIALTARDKALRHIPVKAIILSVKGEELSEKWM